MLSYVYKMITEKYFANYKAENWHDITHEFIWIFEFITLNLIVIQLRNVFSNWEHYQSGRLDFI